MLTDDFLNADSNRPFEEALSDESTFDMVRVTENSESNDDEVDDSEEPTIPKAATVKTHQPNRFNNPPNRQCDPFYLRPLRKTNGRRVIHQSSNWPPQSTCCSVGHLPKSWIDRTQDQPLRNNANGNSSSGKEFLVTFPENALYPNEPKQQCIIVTTVLNAASVQVTSLSLSINFTQTVNITSAEGGYICLEEGIQLSGSGITDKVVRIISDNDVNVLAVDFGGFSMDVYLALPVDQFGFSFYVVTYQSTGDKTQFSVTSSSADTSVTIEFPSGLATLQYNSITILNPDIINVTLQKHEVIQFQNDRDLTGTYVSSNKPIAVIAGARKSSLDTTKTKDHLVQQMTPVTTWGKHFVSVLSPEKTNTSEDLYRILASTSNTTVHVGGSIYNLEKEGDWLETRISATDPVKITSNEAILVVKTGLKSWMRP
ncbi:IgGFc-binding protein-like [Haliotis rubra]|uniref:IgGFc-binding protein-like n=1 Tax=Haliotis rubra TaxID=36100 RepID=UPI001EE4F49A|nr:IgGFc-binding protein-like [Haliotis rubra]